MSIIYLVVNPKNEGDIFGSFSCKEDADGYIDSLDGIGKIRMIMAADYGV